MREAARLVYLDDLTAAFGLAEHQRDTAVALLAECRALLADATACATVAPCDDWWSRRATLLAKFDVALTRQ